VSVFALIDRQSGNVVADFDDQADALTFVRREMGPDDEWGLFEFGLAATDNVFVGSGRDLKVLAAVVGTTVHGRIRHADSSAAGVVTFALAGVIGTLYGGPRTASSERIADRARNLSATAT
jgi:hypothetical protein